MMTFTSAHTAAPTAFASSLQHKITATVNRHPNRRRTARQLGIADTAIAEDEERRVIAANKEHCRKTAAALGQKNATGYVLFTKALLTGMVAYTFDAGSGAVTAKAPITGPFDTYIQRYYGESPRLFPWDPSSRKFYYADVDAATSTNASKITLYAIDPTDGSSTAQDVTGCEGFPVGVAFDDSLGKLVVAMQTTTVAQFCAIDPATAHASVLGSVERGSSESASGAYYSAYISYAASATAVRVGHKLVSQGAELGVGITPLRKAGSSVAAAAATEWHSIDLGSHDLPGAARAHPAAVGTDGDEYLSIAPRKSAGTDSGKLDIISWSVGGGPPTLLANLSNAHAPQVPMTHGTLGYIADALLGSEVYAAMTVAVHPNPILPGVADKWTVSVLDLKTRALVEAALHPQPSAEGAEVVSLAGFGLVA